MAAISKDLDSMIQKHKTMLQELSFNMSLTIEVGESLENRNESKRLDELEAVMRAYVEMERRIKIHIHVLEELKSSPNQLKNEQLSLLEPFTKKVNERNNLEERLPFKEHAKYREFRQKIWSIHHPSEALPEDGEEELIVVQPREENLICPITKKTLENPMRNQNCGHVYSKEAIFQYLRSRKHSRHGDISCPVAGCRAIVSQRTLDLDSDLERQLLQTGKKRKLEEGGNEDEYTQL